MNSTRTYSKTFQGAVISAHENRFIAPLTTGDDGSKKSAVIERTLYDQDEQ